MSETAESSFTWIFQSLRHGSTASTTLWLTFWFFCHLHLIGTVLFDVVRNFSAHHITNFAQVTPGETMAMVDAASETKFDAEVSGWLLML